MVDEIDAKFSEFEAIGEKEIRHRLTIGAYNELSEPIVSLWLKEKENQRDLDREERVLSINKQAADAATQACLEAEEANKISSDTLLEARSARRAAWTAAIAAIAAAIIAIAAIIVAA